MKSFPAKYRFTSESCSSVQTFRTALYRSSARRAEKIRSISAASGPCGAQRRYRAASTALPFALRRFHRLCACASSSGLSMPDSPSRSASHHSVRLESAHARTAIRAAGPISSSSVEPRQRAASQSFCAPEKRK